jgi:hypothetical protein
MADTIRLREAGLKYKFLQDPIDPNIKPSPSGRNLVPWMALVVFDPDELVVSQNDAVEVGLIDAGASTSNIASYDPSKLPSNGAFQMTVGEYINKITQSHRIYYEAAGVEDLKVSTDMTNVIFPPQELIKAIFGGNDPDIEGETDRIFEGQKV